ncbi:MAG: response regulator [Deltaproteobacteria bacterium]|nr:response regulator [Deltaproteobacteria bacterium]
MSQVLVVEDSATQAEQITLTLRAAGFAVEVAADAESALACCAAAAFDVVLSDIVMPGKSGYELCHELKQREHTRDLPIILMTTLNDPMAIIDALVCGAENFITKPYEADYLVGRINDVIATRERRRGRRLVTETEIAFLGKRFVINSDKEQILNLLVSTFEDIVRANRGLEESHAALREADRELQLHSRQLARSNRDLEAFVFTVSHDLKEPLRGVEGFSRILQQDYASALDEAGTRYLGFVCDSAKRMRQLIDDLLAFSRVGRQHSRPTAVALGPLVQDVLGAIRFSIDDAKATVRVATELPTVIGYRVLLSELFSNLLGNAIKYRRRDIAPEIVITARSLDDGGVEIAVADNGIGVPVQYREKVFGLFQRLHQRDEYPGTGVGLALCKRIVEQHAGTIGLEETAGGGCTVRLTLRHPEPMTTADETVGGAPAADQT